MALLFVWQTKKFDSTLSHEWLTTYLLLTAGGAADEEEASPEPTAEGATTDSLELAELGGTCEPSSASFLPEAKLKYLKMSLSRVKM